MSCAASTSGRKSSAEFWIDDVDGRWLMLRSDDVAHSSEGWVGQLERKDAQHSSLMCDVRGMPSKRHRVLHISDGSMSFWDWRVRRTTAPAPSASPGSSSGLEELRRGSPLAVAMEKGDIGLVRGSYFEECSRQGAPFSMRQGVPEEYFWRGSEAVDLWEQHGKCFLVILSYGWLAKHHPDPECFHLKRFARLLREFKRHVSEFGVHEIAVVVDFCSLWQGGGGDGGDCRTPEQHAQFKRGLDQFNLLYLHTHTTAVKLESVPSGEPRSYDARGWTFFESVIIDSKAGQGNVIRWVADAQDHEHQVAEGWTFLQPLFRNHVGPWRHLPLSPSAFEERIEERRQAAKEKGFALFTNGKDNAFVPKKYADTFEVILGGRSRRYTHSGLDDQRTLQLCTVLRDSEVEVLNLGTNEIGAEGLQAVLEMPCAASSLQTLLLNSNRIGEDCVELIAAAIPRLHSLCKIGLEENPLGDSPSARSRLQSVWASEGKAERGLTFDFPVYEPPDSGGDTIPSRGRRPKKKQVQCSVMYG